MLKEEQLRKSPFYYRFCESDENGFVTLVSIEDYALTKKFRKYLEKKGYEEAKEKKGEWTTRFVPKGS